MKSLPTTSSLLWLLLLPGCQLFGMNLPCEVNANCPFYAPVCTDQPQGRQCARAPRERPPQPAPAEPAPTPPPADAAAPSAPSAQARCDEAAWLTAGESHLGDTASQPNTFAGSCTGAGAPDAVYRYQTGARYSYVTAQVIDDNDADLGVFIRSRCEAPNTELACADDNFSGALEAATTGLVPPLSELAIIVDGFVASSAGAFTLRVDEQPVDILTAGESCVAGDTLALCDPAQPRLECLSVAGAFTCQEQLRLESGAACLPEDTGRICNPFNQEACLYTDGTYTCQRQFVLDSGDPCQPLDTGRVCDLSAGDRCIQDEQGIYLCQDPAPIACQNAISLESSPTTGDMAGAEDLFSGSCSRPGSVERLYRYVVSGQAVNVFVELEQSQGELALFARDACLSESTQSACERFDETSTARTLALYDKAAGDAFFLFVEGNTSAAGAFSLVTREEPVERLAQDAPCDPTNKQQICDSRAGDLCAPSSDGSAYTCQNLRPPGDTCDDAVALAGLSGQQLGTLTYAQDHYDAALLGGCTGYPSTGGDVVFAVTIPSGGTFSAALNVPNADAALYLLDTCPPIGAACVAGVDEELAGTEDLVFTNTSSTRTFFLVADTFSQSGQDFQLDWFLSGG